MEFGKLDDISQVDWTLPADDPHNRRHLGGKPKEMRLHFGAPAWGHKVWVGKIYPEGAKREEYLHYYSRFFNCIELNTSHYRIPGTEVTAEWVSQVPPEFRFCPKIYQGISHAQRGLLDHRLVGEWQDFLARLGGKCGPSFLQLPPYFDYSLKAELFSFLKNWSTVFRLAIEFRHPSWFEGPRLLPALTEYLNVRGIGVVMTDVAGRRDVLHTSLTDGHALLRFIGNDLDPSDFRRADAWSERIAAWGEIGLKDFYLMIHEPNDVKVPEMAIYFVEQLRARGLVKNVPRLQSSPQLSLI